MPAWNLTVSSATGSYSSALVTLEANTRMHRFITPDGSRFVFVTNRDGNDDIYVADGDGRNPVQLTSSPANDHDPAWSPDGTQIPFPSNRTKDPDSNYNTDIWVVAADNTDKGESLLQITTNPGLDEAPQTSIRLPVQTAV